MSPAAVPIPTTWLDQYFSSLYGETLFYGIYCVLCGLSLIKHSRSATLRRHQHWTRQWLLLIMTAVMFVVGTAHSAISLWQTYSSIQIIPGAVVREDVHLAEYEYAKLTLEVVNCFIGDLIMISIALTIKRRMSPTRPRTCPPTSRRMLYTIPILLLITSLATGIGMVRASAGRDVLSGAVNHRLRGFFIAWTSLVLATNLISTIIFAYEFRSRRQSHIGSIAVSRGPLDVLLFTLMWSSILYCCTFTVLLALFLSGSKACYVLNHMMPQLAGFYPTLAVVVVTIRQDNAPSPIMELGCCNAPLYEFSCECCRQRSSVPLASSIKERDGFRNPFSARSSHGSQEGSPTVASMTLTGPTYPSMAASGLRQKLQPPFASSSFSIPRKGSEMSNISLPSAVLINVEVETTVDEGYVPRALTLPSGQSSSLSLLDSRHQLDSDSVVHEANSFYREPVVLAEPGQADLEAGLRLETPFPSAERAQPPTNGYPSRTSRDDWRGSGHEAAAEIPYGWAELEQDVYDDADELDRHTPSLRGRYSAIEPSCADVLHGERDFMAI